VRGVDVATASQVEAVHTFRIAFVQLTKRVRIAPGLAHEPRVALQVLAAVIVLIR
jgi:hypothetical protein